MASAPLFPTAQRDSDPEAPSCQEALARRLASPLGKGSLPPTPVPPPTHSLVNQIQE